MLSTWSYEAESEPGHLWYWLPTWMAVGGDFRLLNGVSQSGELDPVYQTIAMQKDVEIAFKLGNFVLDYSIGKYYLGESFESRRHYVGYNADWFSLRLGKFTPNYGINNPDHTLANRSFLGLGQGLETYNAEAEIFNNIGQVTLTAILGGDSLSGQVDNTFKLYADEKQGAALRVATFPHKTVTLGASYMYTHVDDSQHTYTSGVFGLIAPTDWLYAMIDYNLQEKLVVGATLTSLWARLGVEAYKGLHLFYDFNAIDVFQSNGLGIIMYPRPHWEFLLKCSYLEDLTSLVLMSHYYL